MDLDGFLTTPAVKTWSLEAKSSLLIVSGTLSTRSESLVTGTYLTELVRSSKAPILWALKVPNSAKATNPTSNLLKYLAMQALQLDPNALGDRVSPNFNAALVASATSEEDWLRVLENIVLILPTLFVIIEADILGSAGRDASQVQNFLRLLQGFVRKHSGPPIKIAFFNSRRARAPPHGTASLQDERTHTLFLNRVMQGPTYQRKTVNLRFALRRQNASSFERRVTKQALGPGLKSN